MDLVRTVYRDLKKRKLMEEKLSVDREILLLQKRKARLQEAYLQLESIK